MAGTEVVACRECGRERTLQKAYIRQDWFTNLCRDCSRKSRAAENNPMWNGGRHKTMAGYVELRLYPDDHYYPMASKKWHYCREHRYIMAKHLGRCLLPSESVHHKNGIKDDNRIENLELISPMNHRIRTLLCQNCSLQEEVKQLRVEVKKLKDKL